MLRSLMHVLLAALCSSLLLVQVGGAPHRDVLIETLRADLTNDKDLAHLVLLKFMSELMASRGDVTLGELDEEEEVAGREQVMMRRRHLPLSQRERKAGCRSFFWKTFTSC
ncbi:somatostatin [Mugil cephalus]|uniref:somatostatin n=1 Tax=Mugil cephalus TaxID=48193 RepID=UPI001FB85C94|nr:somatostatin [Mugil cephalus]